MTNTDNTTPDTKCGYCGTPTEGYHSGTYECTNCWDWRKLDGPAARYWAEKMNAALSNLDMHDFLTFLPDALGDKDRARQFIEDMVRLKQYSEGAALAQTARRNMNRKES